MVSGNTGECQGVGEDFKCLVPAESILRNRISNLGKEFSGSLRTIQRGIIFQSFEAVRQNLLCQSFDFAVEFMHEVIMPVKRVLKLRAPQPDLAQDALPRIL